MTSPNALLRVASYHRVARDPALEDSRPHLAQDESVRRYLERFAPLEIVADDHRVCALRSGTKRFAFYARIAADLPTSQRRIARQWQYALCARVARRHGAVLTASFFDPATPASTPFHRRKGGAALLAAGADFDGVIVANLARIGTGTKSLADADLPVALADLDTVIAPNGWDGPLAQILTGIGGGA